VNQLFFLVNDFNFFLTHRAPLAFNAEKVGFQQVTVFAPPAKAEAQGQLRERGVKVQFLPFRRESLSIFSLMRLFFFGFSIGFKNKHVIFHLVTIIPVVVLGLPLRLLNRKCVFGISGFGTAFSKGFASPVVKSMILIVYRFLFNGRNSEIIVQSEEAKSFLEKNGIQREKIHVVTGANVPKKEFLFRPKDIPVKPVILIPARLIREKGIVEAVEASKILISKNCDHEMWFAGDIDEGNPLSLTKEEVGIFRTEVHNCKFLGHIKDMVALYEKCDVVCLPTYHEGLPKALIEAIAVGRPVVSCDVIGVREIITNLKDGILVSPKSASALAGGLEKVVRKEVDVSLLVQNARENFENRFSEEQLVEKTFNLYEKLMESRV